MDWCKSRGRRLDKILTEKDTISPSYREISLEIERDRHTNPKTPVADRKCSSCDVIEDEKHFLLICDMNMPEREYFFHKISRLYDGFMYLNDEEKLSFILTNNDPQCLSWLGDFPYRSFEKRNMRSIFH